MAKSMTAALKVPHLTYSDEAECDALLRLRKQLNAAYATSSANCNSSNSRASDNNSSNSKTPGIHDAMPAAAPSKISSMPILIKAVAMALAQHPAMNSTVECSACSELLLHRDINIGVAMDTPLGLLVPVVKRVQHKSILQIAADLADLQHAASVGKLSEQQLTGGTFTVSNIGSIGGMSVVPVVVVPQVAILALGTVTVCY